MRRYVLIFMMLLLPLQWSWAAAAGACQHEAGGTHFGHHEHRHEAPGGQPATGGEANDPSPFALDPDCQVCQGLGAAHAPRITGIGHTWSPDQPPQACHSHLPEPPFESLLRPPLPLVA